MKVRFTVVLDVQEDIEARVVQAAAHDAAYEALSTIDQMTKQAAHVDRVRVSFAAERRGA